MHRTTWQTTTLAVVAGALAIGGAAFASHGTVATPTANGATFVSHNRIEEVPVSAIARATQDGTDVTIAFSRMGSGAVGRWHTHPGPVLVTIVEGSLTHQRAQGGECLTTVYGAGEGFVDPGLGSVHRAVAGAEGVEFYATFLAPAGSQAPTVFTDVAPEPCA